MPKFGRMGRMSNKEYHGLEAELYDVFRGGDELDEIGFYSNVAAEKGGDCLDLGCGTGRVLIPLAQQGIDITGLDSSQFMVEECRSRVAATGLSAEIVRDDMRAFDIGRQFNLVIVPGASFQLLDERADAVSALQRVRAHLLPGGLMVLSLFIPYYELINESLDGVWRLEKDEAIGDDGERALCHVCSELDRCEQIMDMRYRFEVIDSGGATVKSEIKHSRLRWYGKYELEILLTSAGFQSVDILGDFGEEEVSDGHATMAVFAK